MTFCRISVVPVVAAFLAFLPGAALAQQSPQQKLAATCAKLDIAVQYSLDDNPVAEHLPPKVRVLAGQYQMAGRRDCARGQGESAFERYEIALALLGQPWVVRNFTQLAVK